MKQFWLSRKEDVSGVSGIGYVAEGVIFDSGQCALSWYGITHSIVIYNSIHDLEAIHGHSGATKVIYKKPKIKAE